MLLFTDYILYFEKYVQHEKRIFLLHNTYSDIRNISAVCILHIHTHIHIYIFLIIVK